MADDEVEHDLDAQPRAHLTPQRRLETLALIDLPGHTLPLAATRIARRGAAEEQYVFEAGWCGSASFPHRLNSSSHG